MASSSSAAGPSEERPPIFVPAGQILVQYDHKKGDKTDLLKNTFRVFGGCSGEAPKTFKGTQLAGFALLKFDNVEHAPRAKRAYHTRMIGDITVKILDFDSQKEVYVGLLRREGDIYLVVDRAEWIDSGMEEMVKHGT
ncbi:MAG: hypothetical protein ASARMPREDX12_007946 [Alectoria sarmentosa]|nr:MAG: hypothetical protein ASARMPREDX12_007946 [Alectoria sarmentosa]